MSATGVDALAVAVGSSHAMTTRDAVLDEPLIGRLRDAVPVPLVLHGSSGVPDEGLARAVAAGIDQGQHRDPPQRRTHPGGALGARRPRRRGPPEVPRARARSSCCRGRAAAGAARLSVPSARVARWTLMRRLAVTLTLGLALTLLAPTAAHADDDDPLGPLGPLVPGTVFGVLDPVITLLPPFPVPHTPYVGDVCPGGDDACIDDVVTEMEDRLDALAAACDHDAIFSLAYLRVTENVRDAARTGYFHDRTWLTQVDAVFAQLYFDVRDDWHAGRRGEVPKAWPIALQAEDDRGDDRARQLHAGHERPHQPRLPARARRGRA